MNPLVAEVLGHGVLADLSDLCDRETGFVELESPKVRREVDDAAWRHPADDTRQQLDVIALDIPIFFGSLAVRERGRIDEGEVVLVV